jgi:hypothetical protein
MTAIQTLRDPQRERLVDDLASQNRSDTVKPKTPLEWHDRFCREFIEHQKQDGTPDEELITMEEIVAICKEARAELYEEE